MMVCRRITYKRLVVLALPSLNPRDRSTTSLLITLTAAINTKMMMKGWSLTQRTPRNVTLNTLSPMKTPLTAWKRRGKAARIARMQMSLTMMWRGSVSKTIMKRLSWILKEKIRKVPAIKTKRRSEVLLNIFLILPVDICLSIIINYNAERCFISSGCPRRLHPDSSVEYQ